MKTLSELKSESNQETMLRRRERAEEEKVKESVRKEQEKRLEAKRSRVPSLKTPASLIAYKRTKTASGKALMVRMKKKRYPIPSDNRLLFVVRTQISVHTVNQIKKALHKLRLFERLKAVFLLANEENLELLQTVEPYVTYGEVSN